MAKQERMEAEYCNEPPRSSEEEDELGHSVKKFKESGGGKQDTPLRKNINYKDSLIGDIPGAYQQAFKLDNVWDDEEESDTEVEPLIEGMAEVKLSKETKTCIRAPWSKALIVKVLVELLVSAISFSSSMPYGNQLLGWTVLTLGMIIS